MDLPRVVKGVFMYEQDYLAEATPKSAEPASKGKCIKIQNLR